MNSCCGKIYIVKIYCSWFFLNYLFTLYQTWSSYLLYCLMHAFYLFYFSKYRDIILIVIPLFTCLTCYLTSCTRTVNIKYRCDRRWTTNVLVYLIIIFMNQSLFYWQKTQAKRGGLSLCLKNADVAKEFRELHNRCAINNKQMPPVGTCPNPKRAKLSP